MIRWRVSDRREDVDFDLVHGYLSRDAHWQEGIGRRALARALDHSLCFSAFDGDRQVGFARVITDRATFAWIDDLFVCESHRRLGVAGAVLDAIAGHEALRSVAAWWLASSNPAARALFARHGFEAPEPARVAKWMARPKRKPADYLA